MPPHPRPEPDAGTPLDSSSRSTPVEAEEAPLATDFADLAARFSLPSGGGLSQELASELALEVVLNEIVMQACLATGATGAAIVLKREAGMICRASSGVTAPALGSVLDSSSGLLAECVRTLRTQRADDTLTDSRADAAASLRLGVRSVMVMPLVLGEDLIGVFELFSSSAFAFGDRDERTLEALVGRTLNSLGRAAQPLPAAVQAASDSGETIGQAAERLTEDNTTKTPIEADAEEDATTKRGLDFVTLVLAAAVVACAVLLGVLIGRHLEPRKAKVRPSPTSQSAANVPAAGGSTSANAARPSEDTAKAAARLASKTSARSAVPAGGLEVFEDGKEIFRLPPNVSAAAGQQIRMQSAASVEPLGNQGASPKVVELSPAEAEMSLVYRVDPHFPEAARLRQIEGSVVLDVRTNPDGSVEAAQPVSGPPELVQAATDAVRQWRFQPRAENGQPVRTHTLVTLIFRLPQ